MHIFSVRPTTAFSRLGTPGSTSALLLGAIFSSKTTNKKHKNVKTHGTKQSTKKTLVYSARVETRQQSVPLFSLNWGYACQLTQNICHSEQYV